VDIQSGEDAEKEFNPEAQRSEDEAAVVVVPAPVNEAGVATIWKELEPSDDLTDRVGHHLDQWKPAGDWALVAASRRGKMHAHRGIFREDAFAVDAAGAWHLLVVADGGGSCRLSRVGSQLVATAAVQTMTQLLAPLSGRERPVGVILEAVLKKGIEAAGTALEAEAERREIATGELGTTFLALAHRSMPDGDWVGIAQIGDGVIALELEDGEIRTLGNPDVGATAGVTLFLTSRPWEEWLDRVAVYHLERPLRLAAALCDGVADDFFPYEQFLHLLFEQFHRVIEQPMPNESLMQLLGYEKKGSFDDRTAVLLYRRSLLVAGEVAAVSAMDPCA